MAGSKNPISRIRLVYRRSSTLVKCVVLAAVVLCIITLIALRLSILDTKGQTDELRSEAAYLEGENQQLEEEIGLLGTVESIKNIARKILGLVDPNDVFYTPEQPNTPE